MLSTSRKTVGSTYQPVLEPGRTSAAGGHHAALGAGALDHAFARVHGDGSRSRGRARSPDRCGSPTVIARRRLDRSVDHLVVPSTGYERPAQRDARLAAVEERHRQDRRERGFDRRVVEQHRGRLASELERQPLEGAGARVGDGAARRCGAPPHAGLRRRRMGRRDSERRSTCSNPATGEPVAGCRRSAPPRRAARSRPPSARCRRGAPPAKSARTSCAARRSAARARRRSRGADHDASRASRSPRRRARSATRQPSSSGSARRRSALYGDVDPAARGRPRIVVLEGADRRRRAAITPWNFPAAMITRKIGAGARGRLHDGASSRPSRRRCRRSRSRELAERAGLPPGVLNIVTGDAGAPIGGEMTSNPIVRKLGFTGSTEVGKLLMAQCAGHGQEGLARARRQRAVHRLRRRRPRRGGRGRDDVASSATPARPASAPTASMCRRRSMTRSPSASPRRSAAEGRAGTDAGHRASAR